MGLEVEKCDYMWRKYGEKTVGSKKRTVKRSYYRCISSHSLLSCPAKKRVDRLADTDAADPPLSVSYINRHNHGVDAGVAPARLPGVPLVTSRKRLEKMKPEELAREMYTDLQLQRADAVKMQELDSLAGLGPTFCAPEEDVKEEKFSDGEEDEGDDDLDGLEKKDSSTGPESMAPASSDVDLFFPSEEISFLMNDDVSTPAGREAEMLLDSLLEGFPDLGPSAPVPASPLSAGPTSPPASPLPASSLHSYLAPEVGLDECSTPTSGHVHASFKDSAEEANCGRVLKVPARGPTKSAPPVSRTAHHFGGCMRSVSPLDQPPLLSLEHPAHTEGSFFDSEFFPDWNSAPRHGLEEHKAGWGPLVGGSYFAQTHVPPYWHPSLQNPCHAPRSGQQACMPRDYGGLRPFFIHTQPGHPGPQQGAVPFRSNLHTAEYLLQGHYGNPCNKY